MHDAIRNDRAVRRLSWQTLAAAILPVAVALVFAAFGPAGAQERPPLHNDKIAIDYVEPHEPAYQPLYQKLQQRAVLERLGEFLAPVHWPKKLRLVTKECSAETQWPYVFYSNLDYSLTICYQWFAYLHRLRPPPDSPPSSKSSSAAW